MTVTIRIRKESKQSTFSKRAFIQILEEHTDFSKKTIIDYTISISKNTEVSFSLEKTDLEVYDFLEKVVINTGLFISCKKETKEIKLIDFEEIRHKYFEDNEDLNDYFVDDSGLLIHRPTMSIIIIEIDEDWPTIEDYFKRLQNSSG